MKRCTKQVFEGLAIAVLLAGVAATAAEPAAMPEGSDFDREVAETAREMVALAARVAATPGSPQSDYVLHFLLEPAERRRPPVDATTAALLLGMVPRSSADLEADAVGRLLAEADDNAWFALVLMDHAHRDAKDTALFAKAFELGSQAPVYRSAVVALTEEFAARIPADVGDPARPAAERVIGAADFFATPGAGSHVGLFFACRDATGAVRDRCTRLATTVHAGAATMVEALAAATVLDRLDPGAAARKPRETALRDLRARALAITGDPASFTAPVAARYYDVWRDGGELAAWRWLLAEVDGAQDADA